MEASERIEQLIAHAHARRASDLHLEPKPDGAEVWMRVDGVMRKVDRIPHEEYRPLIVRLKALSGLQVHRTDIPQGGRMEASVNGNRLALRVTLLPSLHGEKAVIRFPVQRLFSLAELGMDEKTFERFVNLLCQPQGAILLTGPANSGKTTTMYAALIHIHQESGGTKSLYTIEDPVEQDIGVATQIEVKPHAGLTFASALRTVLRQDPEVIMVGEIRDPETAELAIRAGLTGHLVLSTVHARSASGVFARLTDMGVAPHLVSSSVVAVLEQRLVRKVCPHCARPCEPSTEEVRALGLDELPDGNYVKGEGCEVCDGTGYKGRTGIFSLLLVEDEIRKLVVSLAPTAEIERVAREEGMRTLLDDGLEKARRGVTTLSELKRVLGRPMS